MRISLFLKNQLSKANLFVAVHHVETVIDVLNLEIIRIFVFELIETIKIESAHVNKILGIEIEVIR